MAREFVAMRYDIKAFLRELALTRVYQRSSEPPAGASPGDDRGGGIELHRRLLEDRDARATGLERHARAGCGRPDEAQVEEKLDGHDPKMRAIFQIDARRRALRATMIEERVHDAVATKCRGIRPPVRGGAGQPQDATEPTVHQALFLSNGRQIQNWLAPSNGSLVGRLAAITDASAIADELYLSLYTRRPTDEERTEVVRHLADRGKERVPALQELAWALLASTEFRFNH